MANNIVSRLLEELNGPAPALRREAARALGQMGERSAVAALIDHLTDGDPDVEEAATEALCKLRGREVAVRLMPMLSTEHVGLRNRAIQILRVVGGDAMEMLARLMAEGDRDQRIFCADILGSVANPSCVKPLVDALADEDPNVRSTAADSLGKLGPMASAAVGPLLGLLEDDEWVQFTAVQALARIKAPSAVEPLLTHLPLASELVQLRIVEALGDFGGRKIIEPLVEALMTADGLLQVVIAGALVKVSDPQTLKAMSPLAREKLDAGLWDALNDPSENVKAQALQGLAMLADPSSVYNILELARQTDNERIIALIYEALLAIGSLPPLVGAALAPDERLAMVAVGVLSRMAGDEARECLVKALRHPAAGVRAQAVRGLGMKRHRQAAPMMLPLLSDPSDEVVLEAAKALGRLRAPDATSPVAELLGHSNREIRRQALRSMINIGGPNLGAVLAGGLKHPNVLRRRMSARGIGQLGASDVADKLPPLLYDEDDGVRRVAVWAMAQAMGESALPHMKAVLDDPSAMVREALVTALAETENPTAHKLLIRALDDTSPSLRLHAVNCLGRAETPLAVFPLIEMLSAGEPKLTLAAAKALGKIRDHRCIPALLGLLSDPDPKIREVADRAIQNIEGRV